MTMIVDGTAGITFPNSTTQAGAVSQPAAPFTVNGLVYATGTSALATGSALSFNGSKFAVSNPSGGNTIQCTDTSSADFNVNLSSGVTLLTPSTGILAFGTSSTERMRLTSTGLGIGTTTPAKLLDVSYSTTSTTATTAASIQLVNPQNAVGYYSGVINFCRINSSSPMAYIGSIQIDTTGNSANGLVFGTKNGTSTVDERMRLSADGSLLVGTTTAGGWQGNARGEFYSDAGTFGNAGGVTLSVYHAGTNSVATNIRINSTSNYLMQFQYNGATTVGYISTNGSSTSYNTSSDYRLKNTIAPMTGALAKVALLKPVTYKWNLDNSDAEGFIAHELAEVCPRAVTGTKDAVDADGNPKYQGIDTSFLVATLTSAIQELNTTMASLTERITALESKTV